MTFEDVLMEPTDRQKILNILEDMKNEYYSKKFNDHFTDYLEGYYDALEDIYKKVDEL